MITEDYVSFETAKLLKEKGFDEPCECLYDTENNDVSIVNGWMTVSNSELEEREFVCYSAPTQQMAMRWLREIPKISIEIGSEGYLVDNDVIWECDIKAGHKLYFRHIIGKSFESVVEEAIKYCLEKLIP